MENYSYLHLVYVLPVIVARGQGEQLKSVKEKSPYLIQGVK